ncbi:MAG: ABC transporter substrate-binding protein [Gammaproteobacteria bacterium]|nr:ABC transporter substrate-binding protein [Gammaproteobacteria bacterium]NIR97534.1 ABC transporter substrate-binding protein [Gammaproteobacteria bacterium]NIT63167.1 ABC transporter substrate-binding protein [Gammaproteobacteria bacterium]NIV20116.1 hypothetical protein [Gammaproteobacteria bacterium]NIX11417.1 hypothetical protein [Gammaproteobacteria bacterium]
MRPKKNPGIAVALIAAVVALIAGAQDTDSPGRFVRDAAERLLSEVEDRKRELKEHPERVQEVVRRILLPVVDVVGAARWVMGKYWHRSTPEQRERFATEFTDLLIRSYSAPLVDYTDVKISVRDTQRSQDGRQAIVRTTIAPGDREPINVDFRLHGRSGEWKVYDVMVEGVSALVNFRTAYYEYIARWGVDGLIERLAEKNRIGAYADEELAPGTGPAQ